MTAPLSGGLDDLDSERPDQPFVTQVGGRPVQFGAASEVGWQDLLAALGHWPMFLDLFGPADPADADLVEHLPIWKMQALLRAWRIHHGLSTSDRDHRRLAGMLGKRAYRTAIERDLHEVHGLDLTVEWQSRRWRRLLAFIDGLRRTSHLYEAMTQDDDLAEAFLEQEARGENAKAAPKRRMTEFSVEAELLSAAVDRLGELIQAQGVARGAKRRRVQPMPRPETAMQRARDRRAKRKHSYTVARVYGYVDAKGQPTGTQPDGGTPPTS